MKPSTDLLSRTALAPYRRAQPGAGEVAAVGRAAEQRPQAAAPDHQEKVTLSEEAQEAARDLPPAARGEVRWYRASGVGRAGLVSDVPEGRAVVAAETAPRAARLANPRAAVSAYAGAMAEALAAA